MARPSTCTYLGAGMFYKSGLGYEKYPVFSTCPGSFQRSVQKLHLRGYYSVILGCSGDY